MTPRIKQETLDRMADSILRINGFQRPVPNGAVETVSLSSAEGHVTGVHELRGGYATIEGSRTEPHGSPEDRSMGTHDPTEAYLF